MARVPFVGIALSEQHARRLEVMLTDFVHEQMKQEGSAHYRPECCGTGPGEEESKAESKSGNKSGVKNKQTPDTLATMNPSPKRNPERTLQRQKKRWSQTLQKKAEKKVETARLCLGKLGLEGLTFVRVKPDAAVRLRKDVSKMWFHIQLEIVGSVFQASQMGVGFSPILRGNSFKFWNRLHVVELQQDRTLLNAVPHGKIRRRLWQNVKCLVDFERIKCPFPNDSA